MVILPRYEMASKHFEGLAGVKVAGKWGFVDTAGPMAVAPQFDEVGSFTKELVEVRVGRKWGYIDKTAKYMLTPTERRSSLRNRTLCSGRRCGSAEVGLPLALTKLEMPLFRLEGVICSKLATTTRRYQHTSRA